MGGKKLLLKLYTPISLCWWIFCAPLLHLSDIQHHHLASQDSAEAVNVWQLSDMEGWTSIVPDSRHEGAIRSCYIPVSMYYSWQLTCSRFEQYHTCRHQHLTDGWLTCKSCRTRVSYLELGTDLEWNLTHFILILVIHFAIQLNRNRQTFKIDVAFQGQTPNLLTSSKVPESNWTHRPSS